MKKLIFLISAILLLTSTVSSQEQLTRRQKNLHRHYDNYYTFEISSDRLPLSYREWLTMKKLVDTSGFDYVRKSIIDTALLKAILKDDINNTSKEGQEFFNKGLNYLTERKYPDAIRCFTYTINTNVNFAFAYFCRAFSKSQLFLGNEDLIPDLTMACNLGIGDACTWIKTIRNRKSWLQIFLFYRLFNSPTIFIL